MKHLAIEPDTALSGAAQSTALAAMVSKTGWTSVGELGDDPQDLAGRRLLLEGLGEVAVARLELLEQADVLDGDDGLVGEGLEQGDLAVRERPPSARRTVMAPIGSPSRSIGTATMLRFRC